MSTTYVTRSKNYDDQVRFLAQHPVCRIAFTKINGDEREIIGTTTAALISHKPTTYNNPWLNDPRNPNRVVRVWDLNLQEWRSFRPDSLITIEALTGMTFSIAGDNSLVLSA